MYIEFDVKRTVKVRCVNVYGSFKYFSSLWFYNNNNKVFYLYSIAQLVTKYHNVACITRTSLLSGPFVFRKFNLDL